MRRAEGAREFLDGPLSRGDRVASLDDIDRLNAWFGGYALTLREIGRAAAGVAPTRPLRVVDVGGGRGDLARRIVAWARRAGRAVRVVVVDRDGESLALAGPARAEFPEIVMVAADAGALPLREGWADVVVSSLTLHHLEPPAAVATLAEMRAVARLRVVVNDLLRTRLSLSLVWLATRVLARHSVSRYDGPLSVRRSYSPEELRALAGKAGLSRLRIRRYPFLGRLLAVAP